MEPIKEAFFKVKQDIDSLNKEIVILKRELVETRKSLIDICKILKENLNKKEVKTEFDNKEEDPTHKESNLTDYRETPTYNSLPRPLKAQNLGISTGNEGVPTDRQTDRQTDQQTEKSSYNQEDTLPKNSINDAVHILESLDNIKKEIRLKFKRLTEQELLVFSTLYQLSEEEEGYADYKGLSKKLNLTESSIRDYIGRLIKKGIPIEKIKINNKTIHLSISPNLKKIASLSTILHLRNI